MRDYLGNHVSQVDKIGSQVDADDVYVTTNLFGSFRVRYADHIDKICVAIEDGRASGRMAMQLPLEKAILLRELLDAGIADAFAAKSVTVLELPSGGAA